MQIDFQKAFDSVPWSLLYSVLERFGFDKKFIDWVKLFNNDVTAYDLQSGFLSCPITIQRRCRQGDPIAPYLFLLVAEVLSHMSLEKIKSEKTKLIWIGSKQGSQEKLDVSHNLQWGATKFYIQGITISYEHGESPK